MIRPGRPRAVARATREALGATLEALAHFGLGLDPVLHLVPGREAARLGLVVGRLLDQLVDILGRERRAAAAPGGDAGLDDVAGGRIRRHPGGSAVCSG